MATSAEVYIQSVPCQLFELRRQWNHIMVLSSLQGPDIILPPDKSPSRSPRELVKKSFNSNWFFFSVATSKFPILCHSALRYHNIDSNLISMIKKLLSHILHNPVIFPFIQSLIIEWASRQCSPLVWGCNHQRQGRVFSASNISFCFLSLFSAQGKGF